MGRLAWAWRGLAASGCAWSSATPWYHSRYGKVLQAFKWGCHPPPRASTQKAVPGAAHPCLSASCFLRWHLFEPWHLKRFLLFVRDNEGVEKPGWGGEQV